MLRWKTHLALGARSFSGEESRKGVGMEALIQMLHPSFSEGCFEDGSAGCLGKEPLHASCST